MVMKNVVKKSKIPYLFVAVLLPMASAQKWITVKNCFDNNGETVIGASIVLKTIIQ